MKSKTKSQIDSIIMDNKNLRIGKFAERNSMSIDTIRYYVELNLIHPLRKGRYFYFGQEQQEQLDFIKQYKAMRFSLDDIKMLMNTNKLSLLETPVKSNFAQNVLNNKMIELEEEKAALETIINKLKDKIEDMTNEHHEDIDGKGMVFSHLECLCCPRCQKSLIIDDGRLKNHRIYSGKIQCSCGVEMKVEEGILLTSKDVPYERSTETNQDSIRNLFENTSYTFVEQMIYYVEEITHYLKDNDMTGKKALVMKAGAGTLSLSLLREWEEFGMLILMDEDFSQLKVAKQSIERYFPDRNVLYIQGHLDRLPIKKQSVDLALDFTASFLTGLQKSQNLYKSLMAYMNTNSTIIGLHLYDKKNKLLTKLSVQQKELLTRYFYKNYLKQEGYNLIQSFAEQSLDMGKALDEYELDSDSINAVIHVYKK